MQYEKLHLTVEIKKKNHKLQRFSRDHLHKSSFYGSLFQ